MNNKLRESEMFVIIPAQWADSLIDILGETPDVRGIYEATRPEDSAYWARQREKAERGATNKELQEMREKFGLPISMPWDEDALEAIMKAPGFVRKMAVGNVEDFAEELASVFDLALHKDLLQPAEALRSTLANPPTGCQPVAVWRSA